LETENLETTKLTPNSIERQMSIFCSCFIVEKKTAIRLLTVEGRFLVIFCAARFKDFERLERISAVE
jgi:hypothetical protein